MKTGFLLQRITHLKTMGNLIQESLGHGHRVLLFYTPNAVGGAKAYQNVTGQELKVFEEQGASLIAIHIDDLSELGSRFGVDVLFTQEGFYNLKTYLDSLERLQKSGTRLVSLSHFFEIAKQPMAALDHFDKTFYLSDYARDLHFDLHKSDENRPTQINSFANRMSVTSSPMFDQISNISRAEARKELGLPQDGKVVLLIDPVISRATPWRFQVWRDASKFVRTREALSSDKIDLLPEIWFGSTFREIASEIKAFCERQKALLIVKSRGKQADSGYLSKAADKYFDGFDDEYFPVFSTYKLLAASDLCITINSMAGVEAVAAGVPCLNIYVPHNDLAAPTTPLEDRYYEELLEGTPESLMNFPGCIWKLDRKKAKAWFRKSNINTLEIDSASRKKYVKKFLGIENKSASKRILDDLNLA